MSDTQSQHYTFGESDLAAERLRLLARVFDPGSRELLQQLAPGPHAVAIDLGCGPGYTSELVQRVLQPALTIGVDRSAALLAAARQRVLTSAHGARTGELRFEERDVTRAPLELPRADVMYSRYLLTHLAEPGRVLQGWAQCLSEGGVLALEETAQLTSPDPLFRSYYAHVDRLQAHYGQNLLIGTELAALCERNGYRVRMARVLERQLPAASMARLHAMNLRSWGTDAFARSAFDARELEALGRELEAVADGTRAAAPVLHAMQQVIALRAP